MTAHIPRLSTWHSPATDYPRGSIGKAELKTVRYKRGTYACYMANGHEFFIAERPLGVTTLAIDGQTWMVDDPPHWWTMEAHARAYTGHVLCAGLGLGLMVHALTAHEPVTHITVVEREQDVIDLVSPHVPHDKLEIVCADYYSMDPADFAPVDGVLFDLFVGDGQKLFGEGIRVAIEALLRFAPTTVRVHGLPNPLVGDIAHTIVAHEFGEKVDR